VFRVMLSGSGLRTFAITAAPEFLAPATDIASRWDSAPLHDCRGRVCLLTASLPLTLVNTPKRPCKGQSYQPIALARVSDWSPWETPGRQRIAGGRPQLTTGIRAVGYAHQCSNLCFLKSMQQVGGKAAKTALQLDFHNVWPAASRQDLSAEPDAPGAAPLYCVK